jgi:hypothetical protein
MNGDIYYARWTTNEIWVQKTENQSIFGENRSFLLKTDMFFRFVERLVQFFRLFFRTKKYWKPFNLFVVALLHFSRWFDYFPVETWNKKSRSWFKLETSASDTMWEYYVPINSPKTLIC